ncbi:PKD domain-containing protein [Lutispora thermophila]|uniref:PKD/Chitinase domain-containing protein n=1 Tax=Lutispora thermophila DSM 19022 TaxID=1122184 RepID=A0A1M6BVQ9_9FIRM|nr:PKD domain-containing protein [Lutispora thermophila]SHI52693.1 hypothetical protein SAMN02745176_00555 [Lutispora thermophila DSM 19022]
MEQRIINDRYVILDTLFSDKYQSLYACQLAYSDIKDKFILNEFIDKDIIDIVKNNFYYSNDGLSKILMDSFEIDGVFYALFPFPNGTPMEEYLSKHNLTIADKMFITEQLLKRFMEIDKSIPLIQYILCDLNNLSVINGKYLNFSNLFCFDKDNLNIDFSQVSKRMGQIICCIFANTPQGDMEKDKDAIPPAIFPIISKAMAGSYNSTKEIYDDFKNTLLYTTFIEDASLDDQIRKNLIKAKKRYVVSWPRFIASMMILAALIGGAFWLFGKAIPSFISRGKDTEIVHKKVSNNPPVAEFSISINKVYSGDDVVFVDKSSDSDPEDSIAARLWTIEKDGTVIYNSDRETLNYTFDVPGNYKISLVVQDSKGAHSQPFIHNLKVLEKPDIPDDKPGDDSPNIK